MGSGEIRAEIVQEQLRRVLASAGLARNERMSRFLRFVVEQQLAGRQSELKESVIAVEVFGRKPDYDPQRDSTVRTEASRLRARLTEYYTGEGKDDPLVIELPKGGYAPRFRHTDLARKTRSWPRRAAVLAGLAMVLAGTGWWRLENRSAPVPIAVLPLTNLSPDPSNDYFADGITNEIIRNLSILDGVAVRSQTSSFAFKGKSRNVREAGNQLAADYIVEGSVLRSGDRLRINAQLIRVRDDFPLWSGRYDRELTDVFAIQDEVSRGVVNSLRLKLGRGRRRYETSIEAYDLYLHGRALQTQFGFSGYEKSIGPFEAAIAKDSSFAPAYAGLAVAYIVRSATNKQHSREDELRRIRTTAQKAIELDPLLAEAHDALAMSFARDGQWAQSENSFRHAIEQEPSNSTLHADFAFDCLLPLGRIEEALREMRIAEKADPLSSEVHWRFAYVLLAAGRSSEAASQCEKMPKDSPARDECVGRAWMAQGRIGEAVTALAASARNNWGYLAYAYGKAGRRGEAEKLMADAPALYPDHPGAFQYALGYAGLGDKDRTIERLERMVELGPVRLGMDLTCPEFALVRGDSRVLALRQKLGLPTP